uniref:GAF domain-containing protein n=1 Tax=Theileria annulata TaxID=5874 RepID=A0A3B0MT57_THEAN
MNNNHTNNTMLTSSINEKLERYTTICTEYSFVNESLLNKNIDLSLLSKDHLLLLLNFINTISKETLPVKCILLTLKTILKSVKCELVEICHVEDSNLIINYMMKEGMLHKKEMNFTPAGAFNTVLNTGLMLKIDNCANDPRFQPEYDQHTDIQTNNIILIPLNDIYQNIWGILSITNIVTDSNSEMAELTEVITSESALEDEAQNSCKIFDVNYNGSVSVSSDLESGNPLIIMDENLVYIYELCYISGIFINNIIKKLELEISRDKTNSLLTLMHSLFSDQLGIQSCIIALTTHAKKLIQAENCTVYLVDRIHNQVYSISSNTSEQIVKSLNDANILSLCVNTTNIIIYNTSYSCNNASNNMYANNKNNIIIINNGDGVKIYNCGQQMDSGSLKNLYSDLGNSVYSEQLLEQNSFQALVEDYNTIRNGIWIPIKNDNDKVLAIIEVINKQAQELLHFTEEDLNLLELFAVIVAPQFEKSEFSILSSVNKSTEAGLAFENIDSKYLNNVKNFIEQSIIEEDDNNLID